MNFKRDSPEEIDPSPDFIKVSYDKNGNAIDVRPVKGPNGTQSKSETAPQRITIQNLSYDTKVIGNWLNVLNQNMHTIREQMNSMQNPSEQFVLFGEQISAKIEFLHKVVDEMSIELQNVKISDNGFLEELNLLRENMKSSDKGFLEELNLFRENLKLIQEEMHDSMHVSKLMISDMGMLKSEMSSGTVEMKKVQNEIMILEEEMKNSKVNSAEVMQNFDVLNVNFENLKKNFADLNDHVSAMINQMNAKVSDVSWKLENIATKEDLDMVISGFISKQELHQAKNELQEEIKANWIDRNQLIAEIVTLTSENVRKMLEKKRKHSRKIKIRVKKKMKRKVKKRLHRKIRKIKARKINKTILAKKLMKADIQAYPSALIVTERRMQRIGRAVFDVAKKMNGNVVMLMQDKMNESDGFEEITYDAINNSDAVFLVTSKNMKKNPSIKNISERKKIYQVNRKIKFAEIKN